MKTTNWLLSFLVIALYSNIFCNAADVNFNRLKSLEDKINGSSKYSSVKKNAAIAVGVLTGVVALGGGAYCFKGIDDKLSKKAEELRLKGDSLESLKDKAGLVDQLNLKLDILKKEKKILGGMKLKELFEIFDREAIERTELNEFTLEEFIEKFELSSADGVDSKQADEDIVCKVTLGYGGLDTVTCDLEKLRVVGSGIEKKIDVLKKKLNFIQAMLKEQPVQHEPVPANVAPQPPVVGEAEKEQPPVQDVSKVADVEVLKN